MKSFQHFVLPCILVLTMATLLCAQNEEKPDFWFLEQGTEPTPANRIKAIQNVGKELLDFVIYRPTGSTFPDEYRQKLIDAGFVFNFLTEEQLSQTTLDSATGHFSLIGRVSMLVVPEAVSMPMEEIQRQKAFKFAFLGKAPPFPESMNQRGVISLLDQKNEIAAKRQKMRESLIADPLLAEKTEEEIESILQKMPLLIPHPGAPIIRDMDQIGDNLTEPMGWFYEKFPEKFVAETGAKLLARRALKPHETKGAVDVFYIFANTKENAKPIDGWFQLRELKTGRRLLTFSRRDGTGGMLFAKSDRAIIMDPITGKIGIAAIQDEPPKIRIQLKPDETLIVRVVRDRVKEEFQECFEDIESLPAWEYEGPAPEVPGK